MTTTTGYTLGRLLQMGICMFMFLIAVQQIGNLQCCICPLQHSQVFIGTTPRFGQDCESLSKMEMGLTICIIIYTFTYNQHYHMHLPQPHIYNHHHHHTVQVAICAHHTVQVAICASGTRKKTTGASCRG